MSEKVKKIRVKQTNGQLSEYIPIGSDAKYVDMKNGYTVEDVIGSINPDEEKSISTTLKEMKDQIAEMQRLIQNPYDVESVFIGDSYTDGWAYDRTLPVENRYFSILAKMLGITNYKFLSKGGIGFSQKIDGINFLEILKNNSNLFPDKNSLKHIFVFGGYNDGWTGNTKETVETHIVEFMDYVNNTYPNATVYIGQIGCDVNLSQGGSDRRYNLAYLITPAYYNTTIYQGRKTWIPVTGVEYALRAKNLMSADGLHPNEYGHKVLASAIHNSIKNSYTQGLISNVESISIEGNKTSNITGTCSGDIMIINKTPHKVIRINNTSFTWGSNWPSLDPNSSLPILDLRTCSNLMIPTYDVILQVNMLIHDAANNKYWTAPVRMNISGDGFVYLSLSKVEDGADHWLTIENIDYIEIPQQEFMVDLNLL